MISSPIVPVDGLSIVACETEASLPLTPLVVDECGNSLTAVLENVVDSPNPLICAGTRTYNYSYTACSGNVSYWSYVYNVEDPVIEVNCPSDQIANATPEELYSIPELAVTNNCGGGFTVSWDITGVTIRSGIGTDASGLFNVGLSEILWIITDQCGNIYNCTTVVEILLPEVICPSNAHYCINSGQQLITNTGETPLGGDFSGFGVVENAGQFYFNPEDGEGTHTITYTWMNVNGYEGTCEYEITVHPLPEFDALVVNNPSCFGFSDGSVELTMNVGTPDYSIAWIGGNDITDSNSYTINGLGSGTQTISVTDIFGCEFIEEIELIDPPVLSATIEITSDYNGQDISCNSEGDGSAIANPVGGTSPYYYQWSLSAGNQSTQEAIGLPVGTHTVIVSDENSCEATLEVTLTEPDQMTLIIDINNMVSCNSLNDGSVTATCSGGTPLYDYQWDDSDNTNSRYANNLPVGSWTCVATDMNSCTISNIVNITEPDELTIAVDITDVRCYGESNGSAFINVSGGTPDYSYLWNDSNNSTGVGLLSLTAGLYTVEVTDANNCQIIENVEIDQPEQFFASCNAIPIVCEVTLGSAIVTPSGGNGEYTYQWSNGGTTNQIGGLISDCYQVTVTDQLGCAIEDSTCVNVQGVINLSIIEDNPISCYGEIDGVLIVDAPLAADPVDYLWSNDDTTTIVFDVGAGFYYVTATDNWGCTGYQSHNFEQPNQIFLSFSSTPVLCFGGHDGSAVVIATGGVSPLEYFWSTSDTTQVIDELTSGDYFITVTDFLGCTEQGDVIVQGPENKLDLSLSVKDVSCFGESDGNINSQAIGGTPPYVYYWEFGEYSSNSTNLQDLFAEDFHLLVTDANDCVFDTVVTVSEPASINSGYSFGNPSCIGNNDGYIELVVVGGTAPYIYSWNGGESPVEYLNGLMQGIYDVTITDYNDCEYELQPVSLVDVDEDCIRIPNAFTPNGDGINDTWIIENIYMYPEAYINVFNRWGQQIFEAKGSDGPWDGTYSGKFVSTGTYLYVIYLYDGSSARKGIITLVH